MNSNVPPVTSPRGLLIYIPTYRRPHLVFERLVELDSQIGNSSHVRVVVADNSETDESEELQKWLDDHPTFSYRQHPGNIGPNANFLLGFCEARANERLWILADDTPLVPGAIDTLHSSFCMQADFYAFTRLPKHQLIENFQFSECGIGHFLEHEPWGLVSSAVYDLEFVRNSIESGFLTHNSSFPHLSILFSAMRNAEEFSVCWLQESTVHRGSTGVGGDYSLSLTGFPLLFQLAPPWERRELTLGWMREYGRKFEQARLSYPFQYLQTRALLFSWGGISAKLLLLKGKFEFRLSKFRFVMLLYKTLKSIDVEHP